MRTSYDKKLYIFIAIIFIFGIICGLTLLKFLDNDLSLKIIENIKIYLQDINNNHLNYILIHLVCLSLLLVMSFLVIGLPINIIYIFYNGVSIGLIINIFFKVIGIKGVFFALIYILITKCIFLIFGFIFLKTIIKISIAVARYLFLKSKDIKEKIIVLYKKALLCFIVILISDIIIYFFGNNLISLFRFLL